MKKQDLINSLTLELHPSEGGYFRRTYTSDEEISVPYDSKSRRTLSTIYYMLTDDSPVGYLHKNESDIIHYYHSGSPIKYLIIHPDGKLDKTTLGDDPGKGHQLRLVVKGGCWKASELEHGEYGLLSEAVTPGFEYDDMKLADKKTIQDKFPAIYATVKKYIKD